MIFGRCGIIASPIWERALSYQNWCFSETRVRRSGVCFNWSLMMMLVQWMVAVVVTLILIFDGSCRLGAGSRVVEMYSGRIVIGSGWSGVGQGVGQWVVNLSWNFEFLIFFNGCCRGQRGVTSKWGLVCACWGFGSAVFCLLRFCGAGPPLKQKGLLNLVGWLWSEWLVDWLVTGVG